jgi:hypothetical protein
MGGEIGKRYIGYVDAKRQIGGCRFKSYPIHLEASTGLRPVI